ncbi:MAG: ASCH domain-containing protein [Planctomycetota bacterium]|nr:ASCH domain-containing protein [Planctomycetota bacterium]
MPPSDLDPLIPAVGIRQPWLELILLGKKTLEIRSQNTQIRGTIYLYASQRLADHPAAPRAALDHDVDVSTLPLGRLVGSVQLVASRRATVDDAKAACVPGEFLLNQYAWVLESPVRFPSPQPVDYLPYGVWFYPFRRKGP